MKLTRYLVKSLILAVIGILIPVLFAIAEIWRVDIALSFQNLFEVFKNQNIYLFSVVLFPILSNVLFFLFKRVKKSHEELKREARYHENLLNANPDGILILNKDLNLIFCNDSFRYTFHSIEQVLIDEQLKRTIPVVSFFEKEFYLDSNFMNDHPFLVSFKQTTYNDEINYYLSFKDIKTFKEQEEIIKNQNQHMIEKNKLASMGEMAAGIAHEINNPLTVISSNASLINKLQKKGRITPEKLLSLNEKTLSQVERITNIVKSLRSLSHGMANDQMENFSLYELLEESINLAKMSEKSKKIEFKLDFSSEQAFGNRGQIVQVVLNLLNNAMDAIQEQDSPWIKIQFKEDRNHHHIYIIDSGHGIDQDLQDKIFVPMFTSKPVGKGTGLGLSLSRSFMNQNMGDLVYATLDGNTCFILNLVKGINVDLDYDKVS